MAGFVGAESQVDLVVPQGDADTVFLGFTALGIIDATEAILGRFGQLKVLRLVVEGAQPRGDVEHDALGHQVFGAALGGGRIIKQPIIVGGAVTWDIIANVVG